MFSLKETFRQDRGFTLIELMVVVLIISILMAIAIPTFLGARRRSEDSQAKSHLRASLVAQKTYYSDGQGYTDDEPALQEVESNLAWGNPDAGARGVRVEDLSVNAQGVVLNSLSRSATLFCIADLTYDFDYSAEGYPLTTAGTYYARRLNATTSSDCSGLTWQETISGWN
jgi:type IV pilus assembly protein PilA